MKRLVRKMTLCLTVLILAMGSANAATEKAYAKLDGATPRGSSKSTWNAETDVFEWQERSNNAITNLGLPTGNIMGYEKLVIDCDFITGSDSKFRILFYKKGDDQNSKILWVESEGETTFVLSELFEGYEEYLENCSEICLSGTNWEKGKSPDSVKVNGLYLETFDDGISRDYATFENPQNTTTTWYPETQIFEWNATSYNQLNNIGLPSGDITKYKKLVVDCDILSGNQFRILIYKDKLNETLWVKSSGITEFNLADVPSDYLMNCTKISLSGNNGGDTIRTYAVTYTETVNGEPIEKTKEVKVYGEVKINSIYLETYPNDESYNDILLTKDMYKEWDGVGADASPVNENAYLEYNVGKELGSGATIYGNGSVPAQSYADLTNYAKIIFKGTEGIKVRLLVNRQSSANDYEEIVLPIESNGKAELDLTSYEYFHLNVIKRPYGEPNGTVSRIMLVEKPRHLVIDDDKQLDLDVKEGVSYASITYNRTIAANKYGTICLPFAPDVASLEAYNFYELTASTVNGTEGSVTFTKVDAPEANTPYIYRLVDGAVEGTPITCGTTEVSAEAGTTSIGLWEMVGSFTNQVVNCTGKAIYALNGATQKLMKVTQTLTVPPYRAYIQGVGNSINETPQSLTVRISGPTGIEQISAADVEGLLPATIYDLMGRPVQNPQKGHLYIQGGKKTIY